MDLFFICSIFYICSIGYIFSTVSSFSVFHIRSICYILPSFYIISVISIYSGPMGAKIVLIFVIISVIGTVNGLILGGIRLPQSLAARNMFPFANKIKIISEQYGVSIRSAIVFFVVVMFWLVIHFITQKFALLTSGDVSEISIALSYGLYIYLYIHVILLAKSGEIKSKVKGYVIPGLAIFGACIILSSVFSNSLFFVHFSICLTIILAAMLYYTEIAVHREGDQEKKVA